MPVSLTDLPDNVLDDIVLFSCRLLQLTLAQLSPCFRHQVNKKLYRKITVVDSTEGVIAATSTLVCTHAVQQFAACLNPHTFRYIQKIVVNTHTTNCAQPLLALYERLSGLWNVYDHAIEFVNYDVLSLRTANSLNSFLAQNSLQYMDVDEESCVVTRKDKKSSNLKNWFFVDTEEFMSAPYNDELKQLNLYVESNAYGNCQSREEIVHLDTFDDALRNLGGLDAVFLHSPLAYLKFTEMLATVQSPQLQLKRLSVTCSHRARNNAPLDFHHLNKFFDLNNLEELEVQLCCVFHHECSNQCMTKLFEDWRMFNLEHSVSTNLKKIALVNYKTLGEAVQFKYIVENHVLSPLFAGLTECHLNFDLSTTALSIDWKKVCDGLKNLPHLRALHISKFVDDWLRGLLDLVEEDQMCSWEVMLNRCQCDSCNHYRSSFSELARVDKSNHYNHKVRLDDIDTQNARTSSIDFDREENIKYLQYVANQLRKEEVIMEQNLHSTGTMLNLSDMPRVHNKELDPFRDMVRHSCLEELFRTLKQCVPLLHTVNFGGIVVEEEQ